MSESDVVRVLIPDHPELHGQLGAALEFGTALCHANDPETFDPPWDLPAQLTTPELKEALDAALWHDWHFRVGDDGTSESPWNRPEDDPAIGLTHEGVGHMAVYLTAATRAGLELLAAAAELLAEAENAVLASCSPETREIAAFVEEWRLADKSRECDASLAAWLTMVRVLTVAIAQAPSRPEARPSKMYNTEAILIPVASTDGTSPATDTAAVLHRIDTTNDSTVDLDNTAFMAWKRLTVEWHAAILGPDNVLQSYAY